jgi:HSP90 family molecular chaperone
MRVVEERIDLSLIDQFCVDFFSAFLVTGRVVITSK